MEITKTEKFNVADIRVKNMKRSTLTTRIGALDVGEGFVVEGVDRETISGRCSPLRKDGRRFVINKLGMLKFQVVRTA